MPTILVINAGSSSIKYQLVDPDRESRLASGLIERIGETQGEITHKASDGSKYVEQLMIADHNAGCDLMRRAFAQSGDSLESLDIAAVGHRVVQGGSEFVEPTLIDDAVASHILDLARLAPLHNPGNHSAIVAARAMLPDVPHVAVFDTAFHQSIPETAYTYAIDPTVAREHGVRRFGFHGISHQVVSRRAAAVLGRSVTELKQIVLHLGNGASACAIDGGRSVDTSMGLTPLEGLVMGTRSGDIDPGVLLHLLRNGLSVDELDHLLNKRSGMLGLTGSNDMLDLRAGLAAGDEQARLAFGVYVHRLRHSLGAYLAVLGGADAIVFTAGVGENFAGLRSAVVEGMQWFGIEIDPALNEAESDDARVVSSDASRVAILVVPTDEEAEIAKQTAVLVAGRR